jgi:hypothetical protein
MYFNEASTWLGTSELVILSELLEGVEAPEPTAATNQQGVGVSNLKFCTN